MGNWRTEWVASTLHTTSEHGVSIITTADAHTSAANSQLTDAPADLNGLVRFADGRNKVSAHLPSHFKLSLPPDFVSKRPTECNAARQLYGFRKLKRALGEKSVILRVWTSFLLLLLQ